MFKKTMAMALAGLMLTSMAGTTALTAKAENDDVMELTMYFPVSVGGGPDALIDALCEEYHKENPNVKVTPVYAGSYADTRTKVQAAIKGGNTPDLAIMFSIDLYSLLSMDAIADIDSFCTTDADKEWLNGFYDGFMMNSRDGETTYGIPWQRSTIVLYYNKDAFEAAGLDPEQPPKTWDELKEDAKKLTITENGQTTQYGIQIPSDGYAYWMLQTFCVEQNGFNLMNETGTETYYDDERTAKGLEFWKSLADDGSMPEGIVAWATTPSDFLEGKTAMMYHTTGNLTNVKNNASFNFGVAMLPANESYGSPTGGGNFYIFKGVSEERQQAAFDFIKWMTDDERVAQWSIDTGYVATRPSAYDTERMQEYAKEFPYCLVARDQLEYGYAELSTYNQAEVQKAIDDAISYVMTDQQDVESALATAQQTADGILQAYR
ncbi:MAG: ABC transporter substrate-binding protein [Lachnospiraceae bacterium]|mgnify:FL=1|nr:ABC transporter substrate-binding protein [Lachnospiraceae bacterium]